MPTPRPKGWGEVAADSKSGRCGRGAARLTGVVAVDGTTQLLPKCGLEGREPGRAIL